MSLSLLLLWLLCHRSPLLSSWPLPSLSPASLIAVAIVTAAIAIPLVAVIAIALVAVTIALFVAHHANAMALAALSPSCLSSLAGCYIASPHAADSRLPAPLPLPLLMPPPTICRHLCPPLPLVTPWPPVPLVWLVVMLPLLSPG